MEVLNGENKTKARTTFLTVICILTFIGSGWGIVDAVIDYVSADVVSATVNTAMDAAQEQLDNEEDVPSFVSSLFGNLTEGLSAENIRKLGVMELVSNVLTLIGGIMMWNLRKNGFWCYVTGIAVLVIAPMMIFDKSIIGIVAAGATGFFGVVFIVLYGVNLKHMS